MSELIRCCRCLRVPHEIPELVAGARMERMTPIEYARDDNTFNQKTNLFACDECYIALGMPAHDTSSGRGPWRADRLYALDEMPGTGPAAAHGTMLRALQDSLLRGL